MDSTPLVSNPFGEDEVDNKEESNLLLDLEELEGEVGMASPTSDGNPFGDEENEDEDIDVAGDIHVEEKNEAEISLLQSDREIETDVSDLYGSGTTNDVSSKIENWQMLWETAAGEIEPSLESHISLILVSTPEAVNSMMTSHIVYNVKTEPMGFMVRRRYNDFNWLRETLASKYEGLFIPTLPTSSFLAISSDPNGVFVRNRMVQLQLFMQTLIQIPFVMFDSNLRDFLSVLDEKEFKILTERKETEINEASDKGLAMWMRTVDQHVLSDADRHITDFKRQLELLKTDMRSMEKLCNVAGKRAMGYVAAMADMNDGLSKWFQTERDLTDPSRNEYKNQHSKGLMDCMRGLSSGVNYWATSSNLLPQMIAGILLCTVQFQSAQIDGMLAYIQSRDTLNKELTKLERERLKLMDDKERAATQALQGKKNYFGSNFDKKESDLQEAVEKKTELYNKVQQSLQKITKGLHFCELDRFNRDRSSRMAHLVASLAATHITVADACTTKWGQLMAYNELKPVEYNESMLSIYANVSEDEFYSSS